MNGLNNLKINKMTEKILCAAIWYKDFPRTVSHYMCTNIEKGVVLCGFRHHNIIGQCMSLLDKKQFEMGEYEQGFITSKNRFLNREEAALLHIENGGKLGYSTEELFSEDLY
jgi:hypothetical protein